MWSLGTCKTLLVVRGPYLLNRVGKIYSNTIKYMNICLNTLIALVHTRAIKQ